MLPDWLTKPESLFRTLLWLLSPLYVWLAGKVVRYAGAWHVSRTESAARVRLASLYKLLQNPPTLLESLAYIVCFLPLPIVVTVALLFAYFAPPPPSLHLIRIDPRLAQKMGETMFSIFFLLNYMLLGLLAIHGIAVAYRLRHGEARYSDNYKAGIQKRIDRLKKKFPRL